uniref:Uncharacterized protein n=1 Tax=Caenorhabditis japonica TaxID=281687 RepID=A0A8R1IBH8_CAEJA
MIGLFAAFRKCSVLELIFSLIRYGVRQKKFPSLGRREFSSVVYCACFSSLHDLIQVKHIFTAIQRIYLSPFILRDGGLHLHVAAWSNGEHAFTACQGMDF